MSRVYADKAPVEIFERLRLLESAIVNANDAVLITDAQHVGEPGPRIVYCNASFTEMTGYAEAEILGRSPRFLQTPKTERQELDKIRKALIAGEPVAVELLNRKKDGSEFWVEISIVPVTDESGRFTHFVSIQRQITLRKDAEALGVRVREAERLRVAAQADLRILELELAHGKRHLAELEHAATHDHLTKLRNRPYFLQSLQETIDDASTGGSANFSVLFIDLDRFKIVNDSLGHSAGDQLLEEVAYRLNICTSDAMTVARLGGDEFAVLIKGQSEQTNGSAIAKRIIESMKVPVWLGSEEVFCSCSIGVLQPTEKYVSTADVLRDADLAMYHSKRRELGGFALFTEDMRAASIETLRFQTDLKNAILRSEFYLDYQPIFHALSGQIVGVEALIRWRHGVKGVIGPGTFIPIAEEMGLIAEIGRWVIEDACRQLKAWLSKVPDHPLFLSINISGDQLRDPHFLDHFRDVLHSNDLSPSRIQLEITESIFIEHLESASSLIKSIREYGVSVSLDDFGTGYSSLSYLRQYEFDAIKIDRSFVEHMAKDPAASSIVDAIVRIGCAMGMKIIAEGVEHKAQLTALRRMACDYVQGYLLSRPVSASDITFALEQGLRRR